jgi:hypothetical protein
LEGKSLVEELIRGQEGHIIRIDSITSIRVDDADAEYPHVQSVQVVMPDGNQITILPGCLVLAAGMGNGTLLDLATGGKHTLMARFGEQQQLRKAHMLIVRGETLPELVGVFPDSRGLFIVNRKDAGRNVWLVSDYSSPAVGSAIDWIDRSTSAWLKPVILQLKVLSPRVFSKLDDLEFAVYEAPKAEGRAMGKLPSSPVINKVGANFWAVWPSKLTLAPLASDMLVAAIRALHLRPVPHAVNPGCQCAEAAPELWTKQNLVQWEQFSRVHDLKEVEYAATAAV